MKTPINFSQTYLYKIHALTNTLDKAFDQVLRAHAGLTLSQFMVLVAISQHRQVNQRKVAAYLSISAVAVKRQVDIAKYQGWISMANDQEIRGEGLQLTLQGKAIIETGLRALEHHVFHIFDGHNRSANLMQHIDTLLGGVREVIATDKIKPYKPREVVYASS